VTRAIKEWMWFRCNWRRRSLAETLVYLYEFNVHM